MVKLIPLIHENLSLGTAKINNNKVPITINNSIELLGIRQITLINQLELCRNIIVIVQYEEYQNIFQLTFCFYEEDELRLYRN